MENIDISNEVYQILKCQDSDYNLGVNDIKKELEEIAVKKAYGVCSLTFTDIRKALQKLIAEDKVEQKKITVDKNTFKIKDKI